MFVNYIKLGKFFIFLTMKEEKFLFIISHTHTIRINLTKLVQDLYEENFVTNEHN